MATQLQQDVFKELGLQDLPSDRQEEILVAMTEIILKRITLRVLERLGEKQRAEFDAVCASGDQEKINQFFLDSISDYEKMIGDEIARFKTEMGETVDALLA